jgi:hypothetical protein
MSRAACGLLRALVSRAGVSRDRILLTAVTSTDWQSLTLVGERHCLELRVPGEDSAQIVATMCAGLEDAEFRISGQIVADISLVGGPVASADGSTIVKVEALTVSE